MPMTQVASVQNYDFGAPESGQQADVPASLTTALGGANNDLVFTAQLPGTAGNDITITYVVAGNNTPLSIGVVGNAITVNVATGPGGAATSTAAQVLAAIQASAPASALVSVALAAANDGSGVVDAIGATNLAGGLDRDDATNVLRFRVKNQGQGGKLTARVEAPDKDLTVSFLVSQDGVDFVPTTALNNGEAVSSVVVKAGCHADFELVLRPGQDVFLRLGATGGARGQLQLRESILVIERV